MEHKAHTRLFPNDMHTVGQDIEHKAHPIICLSSEIYTEGQDDEQKRKNNHACIRFRLLGDMHTSGVHNEHTHTLIKSVSLMKCIQFGKTGVSLMICIHI